MLTLVLMTVTAACSNTPATSNVDDVAEASDEAGGGDAPAEGARVTTTDDDDQETHSLGEPGENLAMIDPEDNPAARWDARIAERFEAIERPRASLAEFATAADGWCWDLLDADTVGWMFRKDPNVGSAVRKVTGADCALQVPVVEGNGRTSATTWAAMLDRRWSRAVSWGDRDTFDERATSFCTNTATSVDVMLDVELSHSEQLELIGMVNNGECDLLRS